jgi:hypothetical protein
LPKTVDLFLGHPKNLKRASLCVARGREGRRRDPALGLRDIMESIRPEKSDPIPLQSTPHRVGTIMLRFVGLLFLAVAALALVYMR